MSDLVIVKLVRAWEGRPVGDVLALPEREAASMIRHGRAVIAPADLVALARQSRVETAMADGAPEHAASRLGASLGRVAPVGAAGGRAGASPVAVPAASLDGE